MKFTEQYPLTPFQCSDINKALAIIRAYPLATLCVQGETAPDIMQVPLILTDHREQSLTVQGHIDANNPFCRYIEANVPVACLFSGPNSYISPSIYPDEQYPGWNYFSVQARGIVRPLPDQALTDLLLETARQNEPADSGYKLTSGQARFSDLLQYIKGFSIQISDWQAILKLAQDKSQQNKSIAAEFLTKQSSQDISNLLKSLLEH